MSLSPSFPDIHQWYSAERVATEEAIWAQGQHYVENAKRIRQVCDEHLLKSVVEYGCGTGWIPTVLSRDLDYTGIDANYHMLVIARTKSPANFIWEDIREVELTCDLACSFAVLKHFSLADWPVVLKNILKSARFGLFNQHCLPDFRRPFDAGQEWHSCWPRHSDIVTAVEAAGHVILSEDDSHRDTVVDAPETYFVTQRRSTAP